MSTLTSSPYLYPFDALVLVRVSATNAYGTSTPATNFGSARIRSAPIKMTDITIASYSDSQITITWDSFSGTDAGNSAITSYNLWWNQGNASSATT